MNAINPKTAAIPPLDRYRRLPPGHKLVMQMKALVFFPQTKGAFLEAMKASGLRAPDGKAWAHASLAAIVDSLKAQGLLDPDGICLPGLAHAVAIEAMASHEAPRLATGALRQAHLISTQTYHYAYNPEAFLETLLCGIRVALYANDERMFAQSRAELEKRFGPAILANFLARAFEFVTPAAAWVAVRAPAVRPVLLEGLLLGFLRTGEASAECASIIALARAGQQHAAVLARLDLLALRLDGLERGIARLPDSAPDDKLALQAAVAFLSGDNDNAVRLYREALKQRRKRLGKRKLFLTDEHCLFFPMALLRTNDPALRDEIRAGLDAAMPRDPEEADPGLLAIEALLHLAQGMEAKARQSVALLARHMPPDPLTAGVVAVAAYALDPSLSRDALANLAERFARARDAQPLAARMFAEVLAKADPHPGPYKAWLKQTGTGIGVSFTGLIEVQAPWERVLESLDAFLGAGEGKADADKAPRKSKRLVWFVDPEDMHVSVAEQSAKGKDGWTDGRAVAMKRLHEQDPRLDYLTPQDRLGLRAIRKESGGWYGEEQFYFDHDRAIAALVGHPAVFHARHRAQPLELVSYPVELLVTEQKGGYRIALSHQADKPQVFLEAETPTRYRVIDFPKSLLPVQEILGKQGLNAPKEARDRVVAMVRRTNPALPIRAEIAGADMPGVEGQTAPVAQIVPYEDGLKLTLLVRPFGAEGPAYVAGLGGRSVLARIAGQQVRANRDLSRELAERAALIAACPTLRDRGGEDAHELVVEDLEGSLELLLELRSYEAPLVIEWPEGKSMRVSPVQPGKFKMSVAKDRDWFSVEGSVALDEDQVLEMRFLLERLDKAHGRFVPLGDGRFVALTRQLQQQLQRLTAVSEPHKNGRRVHALGAPALDAVLEDAGEVKSDAAWKKHVAQIRSAEGWTPVLPATLQAELRDYQVEGFVWMSRLARWGAGACLADDMGLGKTVQAIAVILDQAEQGPVLVVAPTSVCPNWEAEIARFAPTLRVSRLAGDRAGLIAGLGPRDVLVCSYGLLGEPLAAREWQMVVLDEAQAIKNAETKRAQAVTALQARFRLALTGTPVENYLDELWSLFSFVNPGVLGSREGFQKRFARPIERDRDPAARQALRALIRPFLLRRTKAAVLSELPPRTEQTMNVEMSDAERAFYEALRQQSLERIAAMDAPAGRRKIQILAEIMRLRRACCNPALIDAAAAVPSGKLAAFMELVDDLVRNKHRALVFSQFVGHLELVRAALDARKIRYEYLDGSTPSSEREKRVASFQKGGADLFLISLRAGGTGLNLTAADYVVHLDPWWNPAVEDQASDRAHRIGQERPVTIYRLIMADSIEQQILALHRDKRDLASDILEGGEVSARLSEDALLELIKG